MTQVHASDLARLTAEVEQFYARHMQLLDSGEAAAWADTFTEDAVVVLPTLLAPVRGRAALAEAVGRAGRDLAARQEVHRHWHGMTAIDPDEDGETLRIRCYALVIATVRGGAPQLHRSCVCQDVLVRANGGWLVRERAVTRDDLP